MALGVHRCRFVGWSPSPITALALPPPHKSHNLPFPPLAVGRQNGSIELYRWAAKGSSPHAGFSIPHSPVLQIPRSMLLHSLYAPGASLISTIYSGTVLHTIPSQGGTIWSLAPDPTGSFLAIGCQDGAVRLLDISHSEAPVHVKRFERVQTRFLSIAWAWSSEVASEESTQRDLASDSDDELDSSNVLPATTLVTGCSDSSLRTWDVRTGRVLNRMTVERARGERTLVWSVAVLGRVHLFSPYSPPPNNKLIFRDGTIVSGDSLGTVKFWDNRTATQIHSFTAHNADVLCMTISPTGEAIYTSGVDQRTIEFVKLPPSGNDHGKWVQTTQRRIHSHDVRALAMWPPYVPTSNEKQTYAPLLISAGLDMSVALVPAAPPQAEQLGMLTNPILSSRSNVTTFEDAYPKRLGYPLASGNVVLASRARLVVSFSDRVVGIWRLPAQKPKTVGAWEEGDENEWEKALEMELRFRTNITAGAVSPDGQWLAVADVWEVKLFRVEDVNGTLRPRRSRTISLVLSSVLSGQTGASALCFTPDSRRLVIGTWKEARIVLVDLDQGPQEAVVRVFGVHSERENSGGNEGHEDAVLTPRVSRVAVSPDSQWLASADSNGRVCVFNLDSAKHTTTLPRTLLSPSALSFDSHSPHVLALGYPNNEINYPILGIVFPPTLTPNERKMKRAGEVDESFAIVTKFRPVLLADFCTDGVGEMVVVERPLVDLLSTLPPAYLKPKYGAN
ncbi:U3 small nucleolar RNA-associated protein 4 [Rhizoctonia solani]|uniref:U3 small nucleolar RNA-associated protein 4 n=1 Tax=Rhizoctonia solani TaxID=456999 RepID=A0A8H8P8E4_9AGAM|nr:U3 small nucleolar RNA-associated protein 4 [Rhizoctonia solani]QRW27175.1 U3 small nucleolar RNA-associated protein 4 [Rhizoctonia solani]